MKFNYTVFSTKNNHYLFDGVSCNIFSIENDIYINHEHLFQNISNNTYQKDKMFSESYDNIFSTINDNLLLQPSQTNFHYWFSVPQYKKQCQSEIHHLMIGLTEQCNMRCKYCVYGGHYEHERVHNNNNMPIDILKKSIDYFYKTSHNPSKIINFYGGEPFLKFKEIQQIIPYINEIDPNVTYYITTNGTLLNQEIVKWFSNNSNVNLFISLAGIPKRHDELRVFQNGTPTFDVVRKNLLNLKEYDFESYKKRINFVFNIFDEIQLDEVQSFWDTDELFQGLEHLPEITFIDCSEDDGIIKELSNKIISEYPKNINSLSKYISLLKRNDHHNLIVKHYDNKFLDIHRRLTDCTENILTAVCRPFVHKMFIDFQGNIHLCENFKLDGNFGNIHENFSVNKTDNLLDTYKKGRSSTCINCWASKICSLCFRDIINSDGSVDKKRATALCINERNSKLKYLEEYCTVLEEDENLLDHLNNYIIHS